MLPTNSQPQVPPAGYPIQSTIRMPEPNIAPPAGYPPQVGGIPMPGAPMMPGPGPIAAPIAPMQMPQPSIPGMPGPGLPAPVGPVQMPQPEIPAMPPGAPGPVPSGPVQMPQPSIPGVPQATAPVMGGPVPAIPLSPTASSSSSYSDDRNGTPPPRGMPMPTPNLNVNVTPALSIPPPAPIPNDPLNRDPLIENPLPTPPREIDIPAHLLTGTAMTHISVKGPDTTRPIVPEIPLNRPLPPAPRDVYDSEKYRDLAIGSAYAHVQPHGHRHRHHGREESAPADLGLSHVYPKGWFEGKGRGDGYAPDYREDEHDEYDEDDRRGFGLGRAFSRLRPRRNRRQHSEPISYGYTMVDTPRAGQGYGPSMPVPMVGRQAANFAQSATLGQNSGRVRMPEPQLTPQPEMRVNTAYSVDARGEPIFIARDSQYDGLRLSSAHRVLFQRKLYPSAAHLLVYFILQRLLGNSPQETFGGRSRFGHVLSSFLGSQDRDGDELATQVREATGRGALRSVVESVLAQVGSRVVAIGGDDRPAMLEDVCSLTSP